MTISLGILEVTSIRGHRSRMLRETERETPQGVSGSDSQSLTTNRRKRETMETIASIHDLVVVVALIAIATAPRAIESYRAIRK